MTVCRKCGHNVVTKAVSCSTCGLLFHEGCFSRFITLSKTCKPCCVNTYKERTTGASIASAKPTHSNERDNVFDNGRGLDADSILAVSDLSDNSIGLSSTGIHVVSGVQTNENQQIVKSVTMAKLPENWRSLPLDDKLASLFCSITDGIAATNEVGKKTEALTEKVDQAVQKLDDHDNRIEVLESENETLRADVADLKERGDRGQQNAEVKVMGIPPQCQASPVDLTKNILTILGLENDVADVFDVRLMKYEEHEETRAKTGTRPKSSDKPNTVAFVIQFKSNCVRDRMLKASRAQDPLLFKDIYNGGGDSVIKIYEMQTPYIRNLLFAAKTRARNKGYKHVWARGDNIFARKDDGSKIIKIITHSDLENIA